MDKIVANGMEIRTDEDRGGIREENLLNEYVRDVAANDNVNEKEEKEKLVWERLSHIQTRRSVHW